MTSTLAMISLGLRVSKHLRYSGDSSKFIETIFGDPNKKKSSAAPKKKTLMQMIGYKKPKYATNDDFVDGEEV